MVDRLVDLKAEDKILKKSSNIHKAKLSRLKFKALILL